jgi:hypothetical protein
MTKCKRTRENIPESQETGKCRLSRRFARSGLDAADPHRLFHPKYRCAPPNLGRDTLVRIARTLLIAAASFVSGCAHMIAESGLDLAALPNKEAVHEQVGQPIATGTENGHYFEEYRTRRKLAEPTPARCWGEGYVILTTMTAGLSECIAVPNELFILGRRTVFGQPIRVTYAENGSVGSVLFDEPGVLEPSYWSKHEPPSLAGSR